MAKLGSHKKAVWCVAWSPGDELLASASHDGTVNVWGAGAEGWKLNCTLRGHASEVWSCSWAPACASHRSGALLLASGGADRTVRLWEVGPSGGREAQVLDHPDVVYPVAFDPTGTTLAAAGKSGDEDPATVRFWAAGADGRWAPESTAPSAAHVRGLSFSADGCMLAAAGWDHSVTLWRRGAARQWRKVDLIQVGQVLWNVAYSSGPAGDLLAAAAGPRSGGTGWRGARVYQRTSGGKEWQVAGEIDTGGTAADVAFCGTGGLLAVAVWAPGEGAEGAVVLAEKKKAGGWRVRERISHEGDVNCVSLSRGGEVVASGCQDGSVQVHAAGRQNKLDVLVADPAVRHRRELLAALERIQQMVGLDDLKDSAAELARDVLLSGGGRQSAGHMVLQGPPGVGKTAAARLLGEMLIALGAVRGRFVEMQTADIKGEHVGETTGKTRRFVKDHREDVLFYDEANSMDMGGVDYGKEIASALNVVLNPPQGGGPDEFLGVFIVAGYEDRLKKHFFGADPGLERRFARRLSFGDYSADDLAGIFFLQAAREGRPLAFSAEELAGRLEARLQLFRDNRYRNGGGTAFLLQQAARKRSWRTPLPAAGEAPAAPAPLQLCDVDEALQDMAGERPRAAVVPLRSSPPPSSPALAAPPPGAASPGSPATAADPAAGSGPAAGARPESPAGEGPAAAGGGGLRHRPAAAAAAQKEQRKEEQLQEADRERLIAQAALALVGRRVATLQLAFRVAAVLATVAACAPAIGFAFAVSQGLGVGALASTVGLAFYVSCHLDLLLAMFRHFVLNMLAPFIFWLWDRLGPFWAAAALAVLVLVLVHVFSRMVVVLCAILSHLAVLEWVDPKNCAARASLDHKST
eukprot:TRINITY_DN65272_c0_g1_i1.p1 TRINITY_DN65272_c0_g1~~TRINITY_DN65272_c0_g1_i1.p1  ORF type:complete len:890 (+),score=305.33 TRINITY_DN65272_c0_g1_i1:80-2671(+)